MVSASIFGLRLACQRTLFSTALAGVELFGGHVACARLLDRADAATRVAGTCAKACSSQFQAASVPIRMLQDDLGLCLAGLARLAAALPRARPVETGAKLCGSLS